MGNWAGKGKKTSNVESSQSTLDEQHEETSTARSLDMDNETSLNVWHCRFCTVKNEGSTDLCSVCENPRRPDRWRCSTCTLHNDVAAMRCDSCGQSQQGDTSPDVHEDDQGNLTKSDSHLAAVPQGGMSKRTSQLSDQQGVSMAKVKRVAIEDSDSSTKRAKLESFNPASAVLDENIPLNRSKTTPHPDVMIRNDKMPIKRAKPESNPIPSVTDDDGKEGKRPKKDPSLTHEELLALPWEIDGSDDDLEPPWVRLGVSNEARKAKEVQKETSQREVLEDEWIKVASAAWQGQEEDILNSCRELDTSLDFENVVCLRSMRRGGMDMSELVGHMLRCNPTGVDRGPAGVVGWMMRVAKVSKTDLIKAAEGLGMQHVKKTIQHIAVKGKKEDAVTKISKVAVEGCGGKGKHSASPVPESTKTKVVHAENKRALVLYEPTRLALTIEEEDPEKMNATRTLTVKDESDVIDPIEIAESGSEEENELVSESEPEEFDETDDDEHCPTTPEFEQQDEFEETGKATATAVGAQSETYPNPGLPDSVKYPYVWDIEQTPPRKPKPPPQEWFDALRSADASTYQAFVSDFFTGKLERYSHHDWSHEIRRLAVVSKTESGVFERPALSIWQAAGYKHAQAVVADPASHGCLFWWTPGSGKSVMVALLLELLLDTPMEVFVVSTPQNVRENGYDECTRSLLKFSPVFGKTVGHAASQEVAEWQRCHLKKRKPPIHKKHFLSFRQFQKEMLHRKENRGDGKISNIAVIIDECHELSNSRLCDQTKMWGDADKAGDRGLLESLAQGECCKVFLLSGTPWRDKVEMEKQLQLVSGWKRVQAQTIRSDVSINSDLELESLQDRFAKSVSFVDGTKDRRNFPDDGGWRVQACVMKEDQMHNFSSRSQRLLRGAGYPNFCKLALDLTAVDPRTRKQAVVACRLLQVASGVHGGGKGLRHVLQTNPRLSEVARFAPKIAALCQNLLNPSREARDTRLEALRTRHFVYSIAQSTISHVAETLRCVRGPTGQKLFRELCADELEWVDSTRRELRMKTQLTLHDRKSLLFVVIHGSCSRDDRTKLKAAFGFVTPDGRRYEGLRQENGAPRVHVLLGSHETNQGLTFLRLQHIHLMEPNPLGWSKVQQTIGRGIRRGTHVGMDGESREAVMMRTVQSTIYTTVCDEQVLARLRVDHNRQITEEESKLRELYVTKVRQLREVSEALLCAAFPSESFEQRSKKKKERLNIALEKLTTLLGKLQDERKKMAQGWVRVPVPGSHSKKTDGPRMKLVQTWEVIPDQAVFQCTLEEFAARQCYDSAIKGVAIDAKLLSTFHGEGSAQTQDACQASLARFSEGAMSQYCTPDRDEAGERPMDSDETCNYCFRSSRVGKRVCCQDHFVCSSCIDAGVVDGFHKAGDTSKLPCSPQTCGFLDEAEARKFPPYWTQTDKDGVHLVKNDFMISRIAQLLQESIMLECRNGTSGCQFGDAKASGWGSVSKVQRIENGPLWTRYSDKKFELLQSVREGGKKLRKIVRSGLATIPWRDLFEDVHLEKSVNEFFLFHGTCEKYASTIAQEGFKLEYANLQGLYGGGIYFADAACKSLQYCRSDSLLDLSSTKILLLSRVLMGSACYTKTNNIGSSTAPDGCDSVFAETGKARKGVQLHNEYVVFDENQIYPEYLVYLE